MKRIYNHKSHMRAQLIDNMGSPCQRARAEGALKMIELLNMQWTNPDDFEKKYGSDNNPRNAAIRTEVFRYYDILGSLLREKLVDAETIYTLTSFYSFFLWFKHKDRIMDMRKHYFGDNHLRDYEYLAQEMLKIKLRRDPSFKVPENFLSYVPAK